MIDTNIYVPSDRSPSNLPFWLIFQRHLAGKEELVFIWRIIHKKRWMPFESWSHMKVDEIIAYCLKKNEAYIDYPFGEIPICVKVHRRIFAQVYPNATDYKITLKCEPMFGDFYRQMYRKTVVRGYHCPPVQQPYWNTVHMNG